jgi:hypothetical protein
MNPDLTNKDVIAIMFQNIEEKLDGHIDTSAKAHSAILEQVKYTNGRVRLLEKLLWLGMGGLAVLSFFFSQDRLSLANEQEQQLMVQKAIQEALSVYELPN